MNDLRPGVIAMLGGGGLLFLGSILNWATSTSGLNTDARGLQGLICLFIAIDVVVVVGFANFANQRFKLNIAGLDLNDLMMTGGLAAFMITFGLQFASNSAIGITLAWIGAAAITVGAYLERGEAAPSTPPTPF